MENFDDIKWLQPSLTWQQTRLTWFGHASFAFTNQNGQKIYFVDPFQLHNRANEKADLLFITHAHSDHFSPQDITQIIKPETVIIAPPDILEKIELANERKFPVSPNQSYEIEGFSFQTIPAYNNNPKKLHFHPQGNNWVGYIFHLNGKKIYHAGDTDFIEEMKNLKNMNLDVALLPIGGTYTMDVNEAANAANAIAAKITIPMHYKNLNPGKEAEIANKFKTLVANSKVIFLEELK